MVKFEGEGLDLPIDHGSSGCWGATGGCLPESKHAGHVGIYTNVSSKDWARLEKFRKGANGGMKDHHGFDVGIYTNVKP
jgi:hypothetical protein